MSRSILATTLLVSGAILLCGCSERKVTITRADVPKSVYFRSLGRSVWTIVTYPDEGTSDLLDEGGRNSGGSLYVFKTPCNRYDEENEIGFRIYNDDDADKRLKFVVDDKYLSGDRYVKLKKGDCVFIKTYHTYRFISKRYRSNIVKLG